MAVNEGLDKTTNVNNAVTASKEWGLLTVKIGFVKCYAGHWMDSLEQSQQQTMDTRSGRSMYRRLIKNRT
jgi:hypothetical protein